MYIYISNIRQYSPSSSKNSCSFGAGDGFMDSHILDSYVVLMGSIKKKLSSFPSPAHAA
jgi:hypothetical protein